MSNVVDCDLTATAAELKSLEDELFGSDDDKDASLSLDDNASSDDGRSVGASEQDKSGDDEPHICEPVNLNFDAADDPDLNELLGDLEEQAQESEIVSLIADDVCSEADSALKIDIDDLEHALVSNDVPAGQPDDPDSSDESMDWYQARIIRCIVVVCNLGTHGRGSCHPDRRTIIHILCD